MNILLVGGGGREHAIAWKLAQSPLCKKLYCAPGNAASHTLGDPSVSGRGNFRAGRPLCESVPIAATDIDGLVSWACANGIDFVVVAPDDPLALGLVDTCQAAGLRAFGPTRAAAELEWSKVFSKGLMHKYNIPTAAYRTFTDCNAAVAYAKAQSPSAENPLVIKADGLALGKGVFIAQTPGEAEDALRHMMEGGQFGGSGRRVVIEEFLRGSEVTALCFTDGKTILPMPASRDHKRAYDDDQGPNTGGMGVITPVPDYTPALAERCMKEIFIPTIEAMRSEGRPFSGVLYVGLMLTAGGPKVIEYNARFGDPEAQALLPLLESDLLEVMLAIEQTRLHTLTPRWSGEACACVVIAGSGYPGATRAGLPITGLDTLPDDILVFHAGTATDPDGRPVTKGGRVLSLCAKGPALPDALRRVYQHIDAVRFDGAFYRKDIGRSSGVQFT